MLNPAQVSRLREQIRQDEFSGSFEDFPIRRADLKGEYEGQITFIAEESPFAGPMHQPQHVFGSPTDPSCLNGINVAELTVPQKFLVTVDEASIIGNSTILSSTGRIYIPDPLLDPEDWDWFQRFNEQNHQGFILEQQEGPAAYFVGLPQPNRYPARALFFHNLEPGNYGSFIFRQLPQMIFAHSSNVDFDVYIVPDRTPWFLEALALVGLPRRPVYTVREVSGELFQSITFCNSFDAEGFFSESTVAGFRRLAATATRNSRAEWPESLYISRRLSGLTRPNYRVLKNEAQVEDMARNQGFSVCHPETLSFVEQIALFANARRIAGASGSGMLNSVFAPPGARVLDLESFTFTVRQHAKIYSSSKKDYSFLFGAMDDDDRPLYLRHWAVPLPLMEEGLAWLRD